MKVYKVSAYNYSQTLEATDRQHARIKFANNLYKTAPSFPIIYTGDIKVYELFK